MSTETTPRPDKKPIIFDDHTDLSKIELQYFIDARIGKSTCMAKCEHCWLQRPHLRDHVQDLDEAIDMIGKLRDQGYAVVPIVSDSFSQNGKYLRSGVFKNNDEWYLGGGAAWSSGRPLIGDNHEEMLELCVESDIHTIIMTSHGTEDRERPFRGLTQPSIVRKAVERIQAFSKARSWEFRIILTFTISRENRAPEQIRRYLDYCEEMGVQVARFNRFADIQNRYPHLRMSKEEVIETYRVLKEVYEAHPGEVQMSVSEDFGSWGVEVMSWPPQVGHCVAGENLFGVVYPYVYVCPVNLTLVAGKIDENGVIHWDEKVRAQLKKAKQHPDFGGCIGVAYPHFEEIREYFVDCERHGEESVVDGKSAAADKQAANDRKPGADGKAWLSDKPRLPVLPASY